MRYNNLLLAASWSSNSAKQYSLHVAVAQCRPNPHYIVPICATAEDRTTLGLGTEDKVKPQRNVQTMTTAPSHTLDCNNRGIVGAWVTRSGCSVHGDVELGVGLALAMPRPKRRTWT